MSDQKIHVAKVSCQVSDQKILADQVSGRGGGQLVRPDEVGCGDADQKIHADQVSCQGAAQDLLSIRLVCLPRGRSLAYASTFLRSGAQAPPPSPSGAETVTGRCDDKLAEGRLARLGSGSPMMPAQSAASKMEKRGL